MSNFTIITDSGCDLSPELLERWGVGCVDFTFRFDEREYGNRDMEPAEFYRRMRGGGVAHTSAANLAAFRAAFLPELTARRDILYLGFSSSLSNSVSIAQAAARELCEEFPNRRIIALDTLCGSAGLGLLVYLCVGERATGASLTETARFAAQKAPTICHWFTVDDLCYLRRGGRISAATALAGSLLHVKPVLHMDDAGRLTSVRKVRGRKQAIGALAERYFDTAADVRGTYFISHGDCPDDAAALEQLIYVRTGRRAARICDIGAVIGAHSGPGTLALFYIGNQR